MKNSTLIPTNISNDAILSVRNLQVILDADLADLYEVDIDTLLRTVKSNAKRFPEDFMFQLSGEEFLELKQMSAKDSAWKKRRTCSSARTPCSIARPSRASTAFSWTKPNFFPHH